MTPKMKPTALAGITVLDLSRVLAGPSCTQVLADLGATVWKIEPLWGDETRAWGPPFLEGPNDVKESAYYLSVNRNKKSLAINLKDPLGQQIVRDLAQKADVLVENYKVGDLERYGLDYSSLSQLNPKLIYCSITGFGQTGPRALEAGYDAALQGHVGIMSVTGEVGVPTKVGVAWIDIMTGQNASIAILVALLERYRSGLGQHLDLSLFETGLSAMSNVAQSYLATRKTPPARGNAHGQIVPYGSFVAQDGWMIIAVGNDTQYQSLCAALEASDLAQDPRFLTNPSRVQHRSELVSRINAITVTQSSGYWLERFLQRSIPCAPVNTLEQAFADPQAQARGMTVPLEHPALGSINLIGSPFAHFSRTPATLQTPPPLLGQHTRAVLQEALGLDLATLERLEGEGVLNRA